MSCFPEKSSKNVHFGRVTHKTLEVVLAEVHFAHRVSAISQVSLRHDLCSLWA